MNDKPLQRLASSRSKGEDVNKAEHENDIKSFSIFEPRKKGAFEHGMNTKGKDTFLTRYTYKLSSLVRNEPPEAS